MAVGGEIPLPYFLADHAAVLVEFIHAFGQQTVGRGRPILADGKLCIGADIVIVAFVLDQTLGSDEGPVLIEV